MTGRQPSNGDVADVLQRIASLLEAQHANPHRVRAYRSGARTLRDLDRPVAEIVLKQGDGEALKDLPDIGEGLATIIERYVRTGRSGVLERLLGQVSPEELFAQVPGSAIRWHGVSSRILTFRRLRSLSKLLTTAAFAT